MRTMMQTNQEGKYDFGLMKRKKDWYFVLSQPFVGN
jgi:hypothetical protein